MSTTNLKLDRLHMPTRPSFVTRYADYLVLCVVAAVGLVGSLYVFANRSMEVTSREVTVSGAFPNRSNAAGLPLYTQDRFDSLVKIDGDLIVGEMLEFTLVPDASDERYYLDMGNGQRAIFSNQKTLFKFSSPGQYELELKVLRDRLLTTVAAKEVTIKAK